MTTAESTDRPSFAEAFTVWLKIGCLSFGGPAGQIALMHRILVDEKKWVDEPRFLHALNFCMLLPGPEAQQLATYIGWLLHGVRGGLVAGILFVIPGALVMLALSLLYALGRGVSAIDGALFGIKAAVLVIVVEALIRIGKRALKTALLLSLAGAAFVGIFFLSLPFPLIVAAAALIGYFVARRAPNQLGLSGKVENVPAPAENRWRQFIIASVVGLIVWWAPIAFAALVLGPTHVLVSIGTFFSKLAVVSFVGAYALLAYMAQQAVETYGWMTAPEMVDGLACRNDAGTAHSRDTIRRLSCGFPRCSPFLTNCGRRTRRGNDDVGYIRAVHALDFCRRPVRRAAAGQPATVWRACCHHRSCCRRDLESVGVVRAACAVRKSYGNARRAAPLVCVRSAGARSPRGRLGCDCSGAGIRAAP